MRTHRQLTRRDECAIIGERAARLSPAQAAQAWLSLATQLENLCEKDVPKYKDLIVSIRAATVIAIVGGKTKRVFKNHEY
jgi:hypothetical protein